MDWCCSMAGSFTECSFEGPPRYYRSQVPHVILYGIWLHVICIPATAPKQPIQAYSQKNFYWGFFCTKCGPFQQNSRPFNKILELLFERGFFTTYRTHPGYELAITLITLGLNWAQTEPSKAQYRFNWQTQFRHIATKARHIWYWWTTSKMVYKFPGW